MTIFSLYIENLGKLGQSAQKARIRIKKTGLNCFVFSHLARAKGWSQFQL